MSVIFGHPHRDSKYAFSYDSLDIGLLYYLWCLYRLWITKRYDVSLNMDCLPCLKKEMRCDTAGNIRLLFFCVFRDIYISLICSCADRSFPGGGGLCFFGL